MIDRTIGRYRVLEPLGRGGMGNVYRGFDSTLNREVALKFLHPQRLADPEARERFRYEARAASAIQHANICPVHAIESVDGEDFIVMALIEGRGLDRRIADGPLPLRQAVSIARQIAEALKAAHSRGVIHRDIKPSNVLLTEGPDDEPHATLVDFGLAHFAGKPKITQAGCLAGTIAYMSPAQTVGDAIDHRSDLWSLGCVLYEMLTGASPFEAPRDQAILYSIQHEDPPRLREVRPDAPTQLEAVLVRCLAKDPAQGYQQASQLSRDLQRVAAQLNLEAESSAGGLLHRRRWALAAALTLGAVAAASIVYRGIDRPLAHDGRQFPLHARSLTAYLGIERYPHLSPTAKAVAFAWTGPAGGNYDIYVRSVDGSDPDRLTSHPAADIEPRWSPAGDRIAFVRPTAGPDGRERFRIIVIPAIGGEERVVFEAEEQSCDATARFDWAPDGRSLAVAYSPGGGQPCALFRVDLESGAVERLTRPEPGALGDCCPAFSPQGGSLAFLRLSAFLRGDVHLLDLSDPAPTAERIRRLTNDGIWMDRPAWDGDGRHVFALSAGAGQGGVWRVPARGGEPELAFALPIGQYPHFTMSRDGSLVVFPSESMRSDLVELEPTPDGLLRLAGHAFPSSAFEGAPHYSPGGDRLIFVSTRNQGKASFWVGSTSTGAATPLEATRGFHAGSPRWSPDGERLAFDAFQDGDWDVYVLDLVSNVVLRITSSPAEDVMPEWSPDGQTVYFSSDRTGRFEVWRRMLGDPAPVQVTRNGGLRPRFGDSESELFYLRDRSDYSSLWTSDSSGRGERRLVDFVFNRNFEARNGRLYFVSTDRFPNAPPVDWLGSIAYRKKPASPRRLFDYPEQTRASLGLTIHPLSGRILISLMVHRQGDLMIASAPPSPNP